MVSPMLSALSETRTRLLRTDRRKSSYKGGWLKIGYSQEEMSKYTQSQISSQVAPSFVTLLIQWINEALSRIEPSTTSDTGHPGLDVGKGRRLKKSPWGRHYAWSQRRAGDKSSRKDWRQETYWLQEYTE